MRILIVEDDYLQAEWIRKTLEQEFSSVEIDPISTESEFRSRMDDITKYPPDVIVLDVMVRWANPGPNLELPPDDVRKEGFYRAGLRCQKLLSYDERTKDIPVILYTVLESYDLESELRELPGNITYLRKEADPETLVQQIKGLI